MTAEAVKTEPARNVAVRKPRQQAVTEAATETAQLIVLVDRLARDPNVDVDKMERIMRLHREIVADNAKREFSSAFAAMQPKLPIIDERGRIDLGKGKALRYALYEDIAETINPTLAEYGFGLRFRLAQTEKTVTATAIVSHSAGHTDETSVTLPHDTGPGRNQVQSIGSSISYAKRYAACAALNIVSRGEDDDGKAAANATLNADQVEALQKLIVEVAADIPKFCKYMKVEKVEDIPAARFDAAIAALEAKRAKGGKS